MTWIDWTIMGLPMVLICIIAFKANSYMKGVSDFLSAGRVAGRYLVCTASGMASMGVISVVAACERTYTAGFAIGWWGIIGIPLGLVMTLTGFVSYRYRETRALTLAQFFEMRYSRKFRIFAGFLAAAAGILNYGIFPAVAGRFFVYFCGLPVVTHLPLLNRDIPTFAITMLIFMGAALGFVVLGGQLTIMVTDCVQGLFAYAMYIVVALTLLYIFKWDRIATVLMSGKANESFINPFRTSGVKDFNLWFALIGMFGGVYGAMAWQGAAGFNCSAASAHEQKMGGILGSWRSLVFDVMQTLLAICALTYLTHHDFSAQAAVVNSDIHKIPNEYLQRQMRVPIALAHFLPVGVKGIFAALMFFLACTNDVSYLHSWGSIIAQDVILPFRKTRLSPAAHMLLLRLCITGVAVFVFFWSLLYSQTTYIYLYFAITGAIFLGGAGSVIIGGLYWRRGTTTGAWTALIVGSVTAVGGIILDHYWADLVPHLMHWFPNNTFLAMHAKEFPINGQYVNAISMALAIGSYVVVSLLTCRTPFNLERMLHRGIYAVDSQGNSAPAPELPPRSWRGLMGIDEHFTKRDKLMAAGLFVWSMMWVVVFIVITTWNLIHVWPDQWWLKYWFFAGIVLPIALGTVTSVWFTIGGITDLRKLFRRLQTLERHDEDDGTVPNRAEHLPAFEVVPLLDADPALTAGPGRSLH